MKYFSRIADERLKARLGAFGAVLIEGPKWCGKTTTAANVCRSAIYFQNMAKRQEYLETAITRPDFLLKGEKPRLIDEWQDIPEIWDSVRFDLDQSGFKGQYVITGSNTVNQDRILHSGIGRISRMQMLPMSLWESLESNGQVSLKALFDSPASEISAQSDMELEDIIYAACRGGWPGAIALENRDSRLLLARDYVNSLCESDLSRNAGFSYSGKVARLVLQSYARNISTLAKKSCLLADLSKEGEIDISRHVLDNYLELLEKLFIIRDMEAWCPAIRSATALRSTPKRCFIDPSLAVAALGMTPDSFTDQLLSFGFIFEQLCLRDLLAYADNYGTRLAYYHDRHGLEADAVIHLADGRYALVEIKLGPSRVEEGAGHLLKIKDLIREHNMKEKQMPIREPDLLLVITGGSMGYTRRDGVHVVPIGCLKP